MVISTGTRGDKHHAECTALSRGAFGGPLSLAYLRTISLPGAPSPLTPHRGVQGSYPDWHTLHTSEHVPEPNLPCRISQEWGTGNQRLHVSFCLGGKLEGYERTWVESHLLPSALMHRTWRSINNKVLWGDEPERGRETQQEGRREREEGPVLGSDDSGPDSLPRPYTLWLPCPRVPWDTPTFLELTLPFYSS